ncbi:Uncharacterized protein PBTT_03620 [Plasmodiophora brassicae]
MAIPHSRRKSIRALAGALAMPVSTVSRRVKEGCIVHHSVRLKPHVTPFHKLLRQLYCVRFVDATSTLLGTPHFCDMSNLIHADEKQFNMTETSSSYYMAPGEDDPCRTSTNINYLTHAMFLVAVARPRLDYVNGTWFDGKIGCFPFVEQQTARRSSKNRPSGTVETKCVKSITKDVFRRKVVD